MTFDDDNWGDIKDQMPCHPDSQELVAMRDKLERIAIQTESRILAKYYRLIRCLLGHSAILCENEIRYREENRVDEFEIHLAASIAQTEDIDSRWFSEDEVVSGLIKNTITGPESDEADMILQRLRQADDESGGE